MTFLLGFLPDSGVKKFLCNSGMIFHIITEVSLKIKNRNLTHNTERTERTDSVPVPGSTVSNPSVDKAIQRYEATVAIPSVLSLSYGDDTIIAME